MKKNSLSTSGLSLSQAQSISNLCNQRALEIENKLTNVNNYSKSVDLNGKSLVTVVAKPLPENVVELLNEKSSLHACQAFLMENIKAKDLMLKEAKSENADLSMVEKPENPKYVQPVMLPEVNEEFGWSQLTENEVCEYQESEAFASHIGQFIHNRSVLDNLRKELPNISPIEWMDIKAGERTPVVVKIHHESDVLLALHESLAALHRDHEQKVNYYKAKVKNLTTLENSRIAKLNADAQHDAEKTNNVLQVAYQTSLNEANEKIRSIKADFEKTRQDKIKEVASLRIKVNPRFQHTVDLFLKTLPVE